MNWLANTRNYFVSPLFPLHCCCLLFKKSIDDLTQTNRSFATDDIAQDSQVEKIVP